MALLIREKYLFSFILKRLFLFLFIFFSIYVLIDYSLHASQFLSQKKFSQLAILGYYVAIFFKLQDLFLPLSFLVACLQTLISLHQHRELMAFRAAGISLKQLIRPLFTVSIFCMLFMYTSYEWILPKSQKMIQAFEENFYLKDFKPGGIQAASFPDQSYLVFSDYSSKTKTYHDAYWVESNDRMWHFKTLESSEEGMIGSFVDMFEVNDKGQMTKIQSYRKRLFPSLTNPKPLAHQTRPNYSMQSISMLIEYYLIGTQDSFLLKSQIATQLFHKLFYPLCLLLAPIAILPSFYNFKRDQSLFILFGIALLGFVTFFMMINAFTILGEYRVTPPIIAAIAPLIVSFFISGYRYVKVS